MDIGVNHTPLLYFAVAHWKLDGGATVTGSHNPVSDNGVKMVHAGAAPLTEDEIQGLLVDASAPATSSAAQGARTTRDPREEYFDAITARVTLARPPHGGGRCRQRRSPAASPPSCCAGSAARSIELYCESDGTFPNHLPDPEMEENVRDLIAKVLETSARTSASPTTATPTAWAWWTSAAAATRPT